MQLGEVQKETKKKLEDSKVKVEERLGAGEGSAFWTSLFFLLVCVCFFLFCLFCGFFLFVVFLLLLILFCFVFLRGGGGGSGLWGGLWKEII